MRGESGGLRVRSGTERQRQGLALSPRGSWGSEQSARPPGIELLAFQASLRRKASRHVRRDPGLPISTCLLWGLMVRSQGISQLSGPSGGSTACPAASQGCHISPTPQQERRQASQSGSPALCPHRCPRICSHRGQGLRNRTAQLQWMRTECLE